MSAAKGLGRNKVGKCQINKNNTWKYITLLLRIEKTNTVHWAKLKYWQWWMNNTCMNNCEL